MKGKARNNKRKIKRGDRRNKKKFEHEIETHDQKKPVDKPNHIFEGYKKEKKYLKKSKN